MIKNQLTNECIIIIDRWRHDNRLTVASYGYTSELELVITSAEDTCVIAIANDNRLNQNERSV